MLSENGLNELAYRVMNQRTMPSYGWWITQGATTTWEEWNGNGSRNHPMFGGGISWFYRYLAGMNPDPLQPGYKHIIFKPYPADSITFAAYSNLTPYGTAAISWKKENGTLLTEITVPAGSTATVCLPALSENDVSESGKIISNSEFLSFTGFIGGYACYNVSSGKYNFKSVMK